MKNLSQAFLSQADPLKNFEEEGLKLPGTCQCLLLQRDSARFQSQIPRVASLLSFGHFFQPESFRQLYFTALVEPPSRYHCPSYCSPNDVMLKKPNSTLGQNQRKRKRQEVPPANEEDGNPKPQNKIVDGEKKKIQKQVKGRHVHEKVGDVERASKKGISTPTGAKLGPAQLVHRGFQEADTVYPTILPSFSQSSAAQKNGNLCRRCRKIDLNTLLSRSHKTHAGQTAKDLSPVPSWDILSCALCSLFQSTLDRFWSKKAGTEVPIRTYSSNKMVDKVWSSISTNLLAVGHSGRYIVSQPEGVDGPVKIITEEIDSFDCVKDWISLCSSRHRICDLQIPSSNACQKLIDCETRAIVLGENQPYVALSYVWGLSSDTSRDPKTLPTDLPNTIQDAMTVTKKLGYQYLWVDRYCIDQENEQEKTDQVGKMDLIYQNAELTIIAAIGDDPSYGLPGVGLRKRKPRDLTACAKIGSHFLISIDACPKPAIGGTRWSTRAWTYQEALLSRRRLVFSKSQMFFECYGMYCCESLHLPLETLHRKDMQGFKSIFCSENHVGIFPKGVGTTPVEIVRRIEEYSKLNLSDPSDILKGMLGIFHAFETSRLRIYHCGGVPILPSMPEKSAGKPIKDWTRAMGFFTGLFWGIKSRSERRPGFPSWSWTGWHGPVEWGEATSIGWPSIEVDPSVQVRVKLLDGQLSTLDDFQTRSIHSGISNIIHVTAWTTELKILRCRREPGKDEYDARIELEDGGHLEWRFQSISKVEVSPGEPCKGIILGHNSGGPLPKYPPEPAILVCGKFGGTMERIGLGWVGFWTFDRYDRDGMRVCWGNAISLEAIISGARSSPIDEVSTEPPELVKSWEEIQLG